MRILDVITLAAGRIIALGDNSRLYWARPAHDDAFQALKAATLDPQSHRWALWEIGSDADVEEIVSRLKEECVTKYAFPYRPKTLQPA
jgi:hypothetical protein